MGTEQETLIYIEDQDKKDASVAANAFAHRDTKNRAYINTLGAELALKYLNSEDIDVSNTYNLHSIKKILEEMDISDIMLPNIHIDVRVVFDENAIFIPKSHFEYNLVPDIYLVFYLAKDLSHVKFLGFFEPQLINKNNANDKYYFIEKEKLSSAKDLKTYIATHQKNTNENLSEEDILNSERIIVAMSDNDISEEDKKYLINQLTKSAELRDKFIEYENFETLSYKAMTDSEIKKPEPKQENIIQNQTDSQALDLENIDLENIALDPIDNIENIALDNSEQNIQETQNNPTTPTDTNNDSNKISDIAGAVITGATTGAIIAGATTAAAAAGEISEITNIASGISTAAETGLEMANTSLDMIKDLATNSNETISFDDIDTTDSTEEVAQDENKFADSISFDDIDTTGSTEDVIQDETAPVDSISFDNIDTMDSTEEVVQDENEFADPISLENIELPDIEEKTDFIDTIDNKISLEDVEFDNNSTEENLVEPLNDIEEDTISLNDIDDLNVETLDTTDIQEEKLSLNDIDTSNIELNEENIQQPENSESETLLNSDIEESTLPEDNITLDESEIENIIPFDEAENISTGTNQEETSAENISEQEADIDTSDFMDTSLTLDDEIPTNLEEINLNNDNNEQHSEETFDATENDKIEPEIVESEKAESFGNNLLDNLSPENLDNISIEDLDLGNDSLPETKAEDISSNDLLSQIDDILNSSTTSETPVEVPQTETTLDELSELSDISDLTEENVNNYSETDTDNTLANINELLEDNSPQDSQHPDNTKPEQVENESIGVLFNDTDPATDAELDNIETFQEERPIPGEALMKPTSKGSKNNTLIVAAVLVTVLAAASVVTFFKPKNDNANEIIEPITPQNSPVDNAAPTETTNSTENILATNAPDIKKDVTVNVPKTPQTKELKNTAIKPKQGTKESYINVNKLTWDVPDTLSYNPKIQNYLRTAGKSLKLSLSTDLLLADEYAYTNQVKVSLKLSKNGDIQDARIISSSGSTQIDKIVLQSVKETLSVVKPPSGEVKTPDFNLALIINF